MNNCPKCGSNINQGEDFCKVCGTKITTPQNNISNITQQQQENIQNINNLQTQNSISNTEQIEILDNLEEDITNNDDDLINTYMGKNAEKLKDGGISGYTLLFGPIYILYRKMWLLGLISAGIIILANIFLKSYSLIVLLVISIILSFKFKDLYLNYVKEKVNKIKRENIGKSKEELMIICSKKGGTSLLPVIALVIIHGVTIYIQLVLSSNTANYKSDYYTEDTSITMKKLKFTIPKNFKNPKSNDTTYRKYNIVKNNDSDDDCMLEIARHDASLYNNDAKKTFDIYTSYFKNDYSKIEEKRVNNNTWYYGFYKTEKAQGYQYSILKKGDIYSIDFTITNDVNKNCSNAYNTIINSLKFK